MLLRSSSSVLLAGLIVSGSSCSAPPSFLSTLPWMPKDSPTATPSPVAAASSIPTLGLTSTPIPARNDLVHPDEATGVPIVEQDGQVCIFDFKEKRASGWKCALTREEALEKLTPP